MTTKQKQKQQQQQSAASTATTATVAAIYVDQVNYTKQHKIGTQRKGERGIETKRAEAEAAADINNCLALCVSMVS